MDAFLRAFVGAAALFVVVESHAACDPHLPPPTRFVGNANPLSPTFDAACTDDNLKDAIDNSCSGSQIFITHEHTYTDQHLVISNHGGLTLIGLPSGTHCGEIPPWVTGGPGAPGSPQGTIVGSSGSVFSITNSSVTFRFLEITGGKTADSDRGGGISFAGSGGVTLETTTVHDNQAGFGGGIAVTGSGTLTLQSRVQITSNIATANGGGIFLADSAHLVMIFDLSTIAFNQATGRLVGTSIFGGYGGGVALFDAATADIGSNGTFLTGAVSNNTALYGGGLAVVATGNDESPVARVFTTDSTKAVLVSLNKASTAGGGVYTKSDSFGSYGTFCARDFRIDNNTSPEGAAIYGDFNTTTFDGAVGSTIELNPYRQDVTPDVCRDAAFSNYFSVKCNAGVRCNEVIDNSTADAQGATHGAIIDAPNHSSFQVANFTMRGNTGETMIHFNGFGPDAFVNDCLIVDNDSEHELLSVETSTTIDNCTFANNIIHNGFVLFGKHGLTLKRSLISQPQNSTLDYQADGCDGCLAVTDVLASNTVGFQNQTRANLLINALFADAINPNVERRDYHPTVYTLQGVITASPAIDYAPAGGSDLDLDGRPRNNPIGIAQDSFGPRDIGCYEARLVAPDRIFVDGIGDPVILAR